MMTQPSWHPGALLRKFVLGAHPIIEHFLQKLRIGEVIATYIPQDQRVKLPLERTLCLLIHNILTTPMPDVRPRRLAGATGRTVPGTGASAGGVPSRRPRRSSFGGYWR